MRRKMPEVALLWDESFLWGLIAYDSLKALGLPFEIINSEDVRNGSLKNYRLLFVPGGWASNKQKALGEKGAEEIREFVRNGGNYFGICGGAGLATADGIGLLNIKRKPTKERVPSFSGRTYLDVKESPIWDGIQERIFYAWWPSQFVVGDQDIRVLATFGDALPDAFSSDLNVGDVTRNRGWEDLERLYKINLDPARLRGEPAVVEGKYGKGKVLLSLIHFDTPDDKNGPEVLRNIWKYFGLKERQSHRAADTLERKSGSCIRAEERKEFLSVTPAHPRIRASELAIEELIDFGIRNFLWFWRTPVFLQWRRGVRGLEYCTLYWMVKRISAMDSVLSLDEKEGMKESGSPKNPMVFWDDSIEERLRLFIEKAKTLLIMERLAMQNGPITYERCDDPEIQRLRTELFGNSKSHGGLFKEIIDDIDRIVFNLLKVASPSSDNGLLD